MRTKYINIDFLEKGFNRTFSTRVVEGSRLYFIFINFLTYLNRLFSTHFFDKILFGLPDSSFVIQNKVGLFFVNSNDDTISHSTEYFESECHKWLQFPSTKKIFIDIGGNIGYYSILSSALYDQVYCFEASSKMSEIIKKNKELNEAENIIVHNMAVSSESKILKFAEDIHRTGLSHILSNDNSEENKDINVTEVQAVSLDLFVESEKIEPEDISMIKIDVEGHEYTILQGMENVLEKMQKGSCLFVEILGKKNFHKVIRYLETYGFKLIEKKNRNCLFRKQ